MSDAKNDIAWNQLFDEYKILDQIKRSGHFIITSEQINKYREARLMTKIDHKRQLPLIFSVNDLSILPITRGSYIIGGFQTFYNFDKHSHLKPIKVPAPGNLQSLNFKSITSEATAINCAYASGILNTFFDDGDLVPTVNGRMSSSDFNFDILRDKKRNNIQVKSAQLEIDGGFEGESQLHLLEAKNYISDDFLIRQLYYPTRLWNSKIKKGVNPIFLSYSNGVFHLKQFEFGEIGFYNSIKLKRQAKYILEEEPINVELIQTVVYSTAIVVEPELPFPQADSFERVINLCELLAEKEYLTKDEITSNYDFDERQTNYYTDACRYLGLVEKKMIEGEIRFFLSKRGKGIFHKNYIKRQLEYVKVISEHEVFKKAILICLEEADIPSRATLVALMKQCKLYNIGTDSTYERRSSTIKSWLKWVLSLIEE